MSVETVNKILVVDDEDSIRFFLSEELVEEGYVVYTAPNGVEALAFLKQTSVDLAIVDFQMPELTGIELMQAMQSLDDIPELIMLTAHATLQTSIEAMRLGSCDFLLKPYELDELLRGVETAMQRRQQKLQQKLAAQLLTTSLGLPQTPVKKEAPTTVSTERYLLTRGDLTLNLEEMTLEKNGTLVVLTPTEFRLLTIMMKRPNYPFTFQELAATTHDQVVDLHQARDLLKSHLGRLRYKLGRPYIVNVRGIGYKFVEQDE